MMDAGPGAVSPGPPSRAVAALVAYDGSDYCGFQLQKGQPSIQQALEEALGRFTGDGAGRVVGSGRTDTGVHARGQVVAVTVPWRHDLEALRRAWNHYLPRAILVRKVVEAPSGFHPRFSATRRTYRYTVWAPRRGRRAEGRFPLYDRYAWVLPQRPNLEGMNWAATHLLGQHDFGSFGQAPQGENTVRRLDALQWEQAEESTVEQLDPDPYDRFVCTVSANAFLRRMVRNLVGSLVAVGLGAWQPEDLWAVLEAKTRSRSAPPAPPNGLVLEHVEYAGYAGLFSE